MRWPFGPPPHLTLKPSKNREKTKLLKEQKKVKKKEKHKNTKNELFKYQSNFYFVFGGCPKCPFLTTWPKKHAPKKHYENLGFSKAFFETQICATKRPVLDKKPNPEIPIIFFVCLFLLFQQQKHQHQLKPPFSQCFSKPKIIFKL